MCFWVCVAEGKHHKRVPTGGHHVFLRVGLALLESMVVSFGKVLTNGVCVIDGVHDRLCSDLR